MSNLPNNPPRFVTCPCQHCNGGIEFDSNLLDPTEKTVVPCPHCTSDTTLFVPDEKETASFSHDEFCLRNAREVEQEEQNRKAGISAKQGDLYETEEKQKRDLWKAQIINILLALNEKCRAAFYGHNGAFTNRPNLMEAYKWLYIREQLSIITGVSEPMEKADLEEMDSIRDVLADSLNDSKIMQMHKEADAEIRAFFDSEQTIDNQGFERGRIPAKVRREVWRRDEGKCSRCGSRDRLEFDHIVPVSKGGSNTARNIELLCEVCNRAKSDLIQ